MGNDSQQNMNSTLENSVASKANQAAGKYLLFRLCDESYGISVLNVREIIRVTAITAVPQMPPYVKGVINLRGKIVPVMDLRLRFGLNDAQHTDQTCIVVVQVKTAGGKTTHTGLIVDGVEEVAQIAASDIEETPDFGSHISTDRLLGMAKLKTGVKALLDIDRVLAGETTPVLARASTTPE